MTDLIPFFSAFNIPFESKASIKPKDNKENSIHNKENSIHNIVRVVTFQQLLANKRHGLRDSMFGRAEVRFSSPTWEKIKNKQHAEQEPRSAHGRAVNYAREFV